MRPHSVDSVTMDDMKTGFLKRLLVFFLLPSATSSLLAADAVVGTISGRLTYPDGSGAAGIEVGFYSFGGSAIKTSTQPDGSFNATVGPGVWDFGISRDQAAGYIPPTFSFPITESTNITNIEAKLIAIDAIITGTLLDPNGQPVSGVRMDLMRIEDDILTYNVSDAGITDAQGKFTLQASKGPWRVFAECSDLLSHSLDCAPGLDVDANSGSGDVTFHLTTGPQPTIESPRVEITQFPGTDIFEAVLVFTLRGEPGGYDIESRDNGSLFGSWPDVDFVEIPTGSASVEVRHYLNTYPSIPNMQFFKARRRLPAQ
jgi:hypothetical protein